MSNTAQLIQKPENVISPETCYRSRMRFIEGRGNIRDFAISEDFVSAVDIELLLNISTSYLDTNCYAAAVNVSLFEAMRFCNKLSLSEKGYNTAYSQERKELRPNRNGFRLPTMGEWLLAGGAENLNDKEFLLEHGQFSKGRWEPLKAMSRKALRNGNGVWSLFGGVDEWLQATKEYPQSISGYHGNYRSSVEEFMNEDRNNHTLTGLGQRAFLNSRSVTRGFRVVLPL